MTFPLMNELVYWIKEREAIRLKKEAGEPKPWTTDSILRTYRFCNVHRQDDYVTAWLKRNWYQHHESPHFVAAIALARLFNEPGTLKYIEYPMLWIPEEILRRAYEWRKYGGRVFNPAYIVSTAGRKMDKIDYVVEVADNVKNLKLRSYDFLTLDSFAKRLMEVSGLGKGFLAAQIVADVKYTPLLARALDWNHWCLPGPGSKRGLNRIVGNHIEAGWADTTFNNYVNLLRRAVYNEIGMDMDAQDMQNCLCEVDKYLRAKEGGKPKQFYTSR